MCLTTYAPGQTGSELIHNIGKDLRILSVLTSSNPYIYLIWLILFLLLICPLVYRYLKRGVQLYSSLRFSLTLFTENRWGCNTRGKVGTEKRNYTTTRLFLSAVRKYCDTSKETCTMNDTKWQAKNSETTKSPGVAFLD